MLTVGQKVIGKFQTGKGGRGSRTELMFCHGKVTKVTEDKFWVRYKEIKGEWSYNHSALGRIVYEKESQVRYDQEKADYEAEMDRLGIEEWQ